MITLGNKDQYKGLVWMAEMILSAYDARELHIRLGKAQGYAIAFYPQKYGVYELDRYLDLVQKLAEQRELQIVKRTYPGGNW